MGETAAQEPEEQKTREGQNRVGRKSRQQEGGKAKSINSF